MSKNSIPNQKVQYPPKKDENFSRSQPQQPQGKRPMNIPSKGKKMGQKSKSKVSMNHLLDFQSYKDLDTYKEHQKQLTQRRYSDRARRRPEIHKVPLHGMTFINVNCKFVVDYRYDYKEQLLDPNVPIRPDQMLRIVVSHANACPICLSETPVAPRMLSSCGHILCLTCLISLLDSEIPVFKKKELAITEKYKDCPLCASVIRMKDVKPVLIEPIDERFEVPKINDEVVLTLMKRPQDKVMALPRLMEELYFTFDKFPWVNTPEMSSYLRIFKGDLNYIIRMFDDETKEIMANYDQEKELYGSDDKFVKLAVQQINKERDEWVLKFAADIPKPAKQESSTKDGPAYYYYQTGFRAGSKYVLSPLDMKVLKTVYHTYADLPSSVVAKVENIRYEELTNETSTTKYKHLAHLPAGTSIGFMECNWFKNEYIDGRTWDMYKKDLSKRSKASVRKLQKEEHDKKTALEKEEIRNKNFFHRENNNIPDDDFAYDYYDGNLGSLSITDNRELPLLSSAELPSQAPAASVPETTSDQSFETTIWGTKILKTETQPLDPLDDDYEDWDAEEMIRRAKEEMQRQVTSGKGSKKKKKKLVLISS